MSSLFIDCWFLINLPTSYILSVNSLEKHSGAVYSTVALQQEDPRFDSTGWPGAFLLPLFGAAMDQLVGHMSTNHKVGGSTPGSPQFLATCLCVPG